MSAVNSGESDEYTQMFALGLPDAGRAHVRIRGLVGAGPASQLTE